MLSTFLPSAACAVFCTATLPSSFGCDSGRLRGGGSHDRVAQREIAYREGARNRRTGGSGLGPAVVRKPAGAHGGAVHAARTEWATPPPGLLAQAEKVFAGFGDTGKRVDLSPVCPLLHTGS